MARDRQRAKQRQAARRAERLAERGTARPVGRPAEPDEALREDEIGTGRPVGRPAEPDEALREDEIGTARPVGRPAEPDEPLREDEIEELADLDVGAPPQDVGRSDTVLEAPPNPYDADVLDEEVDAGDGRRATRARDDDADGFGAQAVAAAGPVGRKGGHAATARHGRVVAFLIAVWAELGRVQWPDRRQLVQLTGVVLFFVLVIGAYLGGLDAIFSKLVSLIL